MDSDSALVVVPNEQGIAVQTRAKVLRAGAMLIADALIEIGKSESAGEGTLGWKGKVFVPMGHFLPEGGQCTLLIGNTVLLEIIIGRVELASKQITAHFQTLEQVGMAAMPS